MANERMPAHLLTQGYARERGDARRNLESEVRHATNQLQRLAADLADDDTAALFSGRARALGQTVAELLVRAGELDMANRLSFLNPLDSEES